MADTVCHALPIFNDYKLIFFSTETSDFLKQIIFIMSFNFVVLYTITHPMNQLHMS